MFPFLTDTRQTPLLATTQGEDNLSYFILHRYTPETGRYFWPLISPPLVQCCLKPWQKNSQQVNPDRSPCCWVLMRVRPFCLFHCTWGHNPTTLTFQGCNNLNKTTYLKKTKNNYEYFFVSFHLHCLGLHCRAKLVMKAKSQTLNSIDSVPR